MNMLDEFVLYLNTQYDDKGVKEMQKGLKKIAIGVTGSLVGLDRLFTSLGDKFANLSYQTSLVGGDLANLHKYVTLGSQSIYTSADAVRGDLEGLLETVRKAKLTGKIPIGFEMAGIDITKNPDAIIQQFQGALKSMPKDMAQNIAEASGISNLYQVLRDAKVGMKDLNGIPFLNNRQIANTQDFYKSLKSIKAELILLKDTALSEIAPALNEGLIKAMEWIKFNQVGIISLFQNTVYVLSSFAGGVMNLVTGLGELVNWITQSKTGTYGLSIAIGLLLATIYPVQTAIVFLVAIVEDLYGYFKGMPSMIGEIEKRFGKLAGGLAVFGSVVASLGIVAYLGKVFGAVKKVQGAYSKLEKTFTGLIKVFRLLRLITPQGLAITAATVAGGFIAKKGYDYYKDHKNKQDKNPSSLGLEGVFNQNNSTDAVSNNVSNSSKTQHIKQDFNITVNTGQGADAKEIARQIQDIFRGNNMNYQMSTLQDY
jgi:hypothetical protein